VPSQHVTISICFVKNAVAVLMKLNAIT